MQPLSFQIQKKLPGALGRAGVLSTPHGEIQTPAFVVVGTKGTVKALAPEQVASLGAQVVLANTYHLYLQPGDTRVRDQGGLHRMMHWDKPTMTDSGGFQAFSLGAAFGSNVSKIAKGNDAAQNSEEVTGDELEEPAGKLAKIDEDGVTFRSHIDGSEHKFTPERSIEIQHNLGAEMIFAFDECTSAQASYEYQKEALGRTHRWAERSLAAHKANGDAAQKQGLLGIVQGGRFKDLREESARFLAGLCPPAGGFDGFGIGGSFDKEDMYTAVGWVNAILPEDKPRHLLGIGEPADLFGGVENGCDLFDCVAPTRMARNGTIHTANGRINIFNAKFLDDLGPIDDGCACYTCSPRHGGAGYTRAYLAHLFRAKEMFAGTLASIHNLHFIIKLVADIRQSILDGTFTDFKTSFLARYYRK
ncbi:MAG: tRNA-guanine(34) transglycosylase [Candidatus Yonathbacteria bacterium RIFCSPHIGHO2_01_FULL_51_10]|uniref:Queuine tRNA-ribosyltransferase n=1 Tax=Candidatus Yonathbacteria bacterium RIFCSPHIGHO2_01_FULL_51_10 TaxID=1802723 RepID=A0A1G2SAW2_9BACT|nr:MAG: tRNA-guanine(34) transglycosylase [Candidatus Yonathbacteria bacterium RIFCSPHIGHO2_01_FULL_51_10]